MSKKLSIGVTIFVITALIIHFALAIVCIKANAPTCDEIAHHIGSGYSYLVMRDFRMNPANPPLVREISALPLLLLKLKNPFDLQSWKDGNSPVFGNAFFYKIGNDADRIIFWARVPMALLSVMLGLLVFFWSRSLYGNKGGILSLSLYSLSPNMIAFASLATVDLGTALFISAALFSFWIFLKKPSPISMVSAGICFGLAQASKYTSIFLVPIFIALTLSYYLMDKDMRNRLPAHRCVQGLVGIFMIGLVVLFASYSFEIKPLIKNAPDVSEKIEYIKRAVDAMHLDRVGLNKDKAVWLAENLPMPFSTYLIGLGGVIHQSVIGGYHTFLLGKVCDSGFWNYFIIAFLVKSTLPTIALFALALVMIFKTDKFKRADSSFLLIPIILFFIVIANNKGQVGIRHLLETYPLIFILSGIMATVEIKNVFRYAIFAGIVIAQFVSLMTAFPYPLAYFNEVAGGSDNGYRILRDSNLDWGQGLKPLKKYIEDNEIDSIKLYYFGTADPAYYKIPFRNMTEAEFKVPEKGYYAISAQYLGAVGWAKNRAPVAKVAHSIFVYKI